MVQINRNTPSRRKRALSEGEKDGLKVEREGKRPKVELEAQLELKFTAKGGSHSKLEKVCNSLYYTVLHLPLIEHLFYCWMKTMLFLIL